MPGRPERGTGSAWQTSCCRAAAASHEIRIRHSYEKIEPNSETGFDASLTSPVGGSNQWLYFRMHLYHLLALTVRGWRMIEDGEYAVWFKTPRGEGTGIVRLANGAITGGDSVLSYSGRYEVDQDRFTATLFTTRHTAGHASLFGVDDLELKLEGQSKGITASCSGIAMQAPDLPLQATLIRVQHSAPTNQIVKPRFAATLADFRRHLASYPSV